MNTKRLTKIYIVLLLISCFILYFLWKSLHHTYIPRDYPEIKKEGVLRIVTSYNSIDYYISGDSIEGFQYNLCKVMEMYSGLNTEIYLENSLEKSIEGLQNQQYDIIARSIPVTVDNKEQLIFTNPISLNKQILVQRNAKNNNNIKPIRNQIDLAKKNIYVPQNSPNILRLKNLAEEIGDTIFIIEEMKYDSEQLIYMVANNEIDYAVVDKEIAINNKSQLSQIDIETDISFTQFQAWALRKESSVLLDSINTWLNLFLR